MNKYLFFFIFINILASCNKEEDRNSKILEIGIPLKELIHKGISVEKLYYAGASVKDLIEAKAPLQELLAIQDVSLDSLIIPSTPLEELFKLIENGYVTCADMVKSGIEVGLLLKAGFDMELESLGFIGTMNDYDGNKYKWIQIGKQIWMMENLRVTHYADGRDLIEMEVNNPNITKPTYKSKFFINPFSHDEDYNHSYARQVNPSMYYTWSAANDTSDIIYNEKIQGICPNGWRIPNNLDIKELIDYIENRYPYDTVQNSICTDILWDKNYINGNNYFGLNIKPNGFYTYIWYDGFTGNHYNPWSFVIWTSDGVLIVDDNENIERATFWCISVNGLIFSTADKIIPHCVRCIKDI